MRNNFLKQAVQSVAKMKPRGLSYNYCEIKVHLRNLGVPLGFLRRTLVRQIVMHLYCVLYRPYTRANFNDHYDVIKAAHCFADKRNATQRLPL
jgi:hypothetical protein